MSDGHAPALISYGDSNPNEVALPPSTGVHDAWGFAIAEVKETLESRSE